MFAVGVRVTTVPFAPPFVLRNTVMTGSPIYVTPAMVKLPVPTAHVPLYVELAVGVFTTTRMYEVAPSQVDVPIGVMPASEYTVPEILMTYELLSQRIDPGSPVSLSNASP